MNPTHFQSWGRYPRRPQSGVTFFWPDELKSALKNVSNGAPVLPVGLGRSYGDVPLNSDGQLLFVRHLNRLLAFDPASGILKCEAGVSLQQVLEFAVPRGWFLPTTPGTKFVTIGGAIANDVHGKNHHKVGTFGRHVHTFELLRSDLQHLHCSRHENFNYFAATIGGLGLTGVITQAELQLVRIPGSRLRTETVRFRNLQEYFELSEQSDQQWDFTVSWVDCLSQGEHLGRGLFNRGHFIADESKNLLNLHPRLNVPFDAPNFLLSPLTMKIFNSLYYNKQASRIKSAEVDFDGFFYPLDKINNWNRLYGPRGFLQYQFVVPTEAAFRAMTMIFRRLTRSKKGSFLAVLKKFGPLPSPGLLSFPMPGHTLALDLPANDPDVMTMLTELDHIVMENGGRVYPAKDARMSAEVFRRSFPRYQEFMKLKDPKFLSDFWRRVNGA